MKTIEQQKQELDEKIDYLTVQKQVQEQDKENQYQNEQKLSLSVSCASGRQDSIQDNKSRKGRYYASFSFRFKSGVLLQASSFLSDGDKIGIDEFFDDQIILERKVQKRDICFRPGFLTQKFIKHTSQLLLKFCQETSQSAFTHFLTHLCEFQSPIFSPSFPQQCPYTINQALQDLFYRKEHPFLMYTFDWTLCHLSFVCCLLVYWMQIQIGTVVQETEQEGTEQEEQGEDDEKEKEGTGQPKRRGLKSVNKIREEYINNQKIRLKQNMCYIALTYAEERAQQINTNQPVLLILYYFINYLKRQPCLDIVQISRCQDKLINNIKLFRRIKRKQKQFSSPNNEIFLKSQLKKYQYENKFIGSFDKTYTILNLICSHNFVSCPLLKYYQLDQYRECRREYQIKKDYFCLWVLNIVLSQAERQSIDSLHNAALYILTFMSMLKKFAKDCNIQGISYLVPILANIQLHMPKIWSHARQRRPEIDPKLQHYTKILTQKSFKPPQLHSPSSILWRQTIFQMTQKMQKFLTTQEYILLQQHQKFYEQFLKFFLEFRNNVQKQYKEEIQRYDRQRQIGTSFNMYLLDYYVAKVGEKVDKREKVEKGDREWGKNYQERGMRLEEEWKKFGRRAQIINSRITSSVYRDVINFCFVGSTYKYQKIEI